MKSLRVLAISVLAAVALVLSASSGLAQTKKPDTKSAATAKATLDINAASKAELSELPGIGDVLSQKIIDGRPYARKDELASRKIIPQATYDKIKEQIIAKQAKKK